jgi:hypothetical protein
MTRDRFLRLPRLLLPAAAAAMAAACSAPPGGTLVHSPLIKTRYNPNWVGSGGPMPLQVVGAPPDGASAEEVAAAMRLPGWHGGGRFEAISGPVEGLRMVVVFSPSNRLDWCEDPSGGSGAGSDGALVAGLAYCRGDADLSSVLVESRATSGPRDAGFRRAMSQALLQMLPTRNPKIDGPSAFRAPAAL